MSIEQSSQGSSLEKKGPKPPSAERINMNKALFYAGVIAALATPVCHAYKLHEDGYCEASAATGTAEDGTESAR